MDVLSTINTRRTAQTVQADPRQVKNAAGGWVFAVDDWARVHRFLTLGTDSGTYYTSAVELTADNAAVILRAAATDPHELVRRIVAVSTAGRAPKVNPALFALAVAASCDDVDGRRAALGALPLVARTGTHMFLFAGYVKQFRGWGPTLKRAVGQWYNGRDVGALSYQLIKYRNREGWMHADLLRLAHPKPGTVERDRLYRWVIGLRTGTAVPVREDESALPASDAELSLLDDFLDVQSTANVDRWLEVIGRGNGVSWEMLPDAALSKPAVWNALIARGMPATALMRQLPRLTRLGVLAGDTGRAVAAQLQDPERLTRGRVHPVNVLIAQRTYASGRSVRGESTWTPLARIADALDAAFYAAYGSVEPAGKRMLLALDVSGSMNAAASGLPISCREASAAIAMVTAATEPDHDIVGFTGGRLGYGNAVNSISQLDISPRRRLDDVCRYVNELPFGWTECALPFTWATDQKRAYVAVVILTDNESFAGPIHVHQALRQYRERVNPGARLIVVAMTATGMTVCDPQDPLSLDVAGMDAAVPQLISDFAAGKI